ncbi:MAG: macro domain-containing protein [Chthoniobacter sp.]|uniref:macro domain-containing protein n=1 Tax=Chthoniobacter sp. TaxID=2510640 RepID=UPI0032ADAF36
MENAFAQQGVADCQSLRSDSEKDYWEDREGRHFVAKLHGDIDTNNILNTAAEIMVISKANADFFNNVTADSGLVVLGASGNEQSVRDLFRQAVSKEAQQRKVLSFGLLWGVYMGNDKPERLSPEELQTLVQKRVETEVHPDIAEIIEYSSNELFCFFPVWGAGAFMRDLIEYFRSDRDLFATAARYLDHELRLQRVFSEAGYPNDAVEKHLRSLREQRKRIDSAPPLRRLEPETVVNAQKKSGPLHVRVVYGDITSRGLLGDGDFPQLRRGVVSPEDTFVSAGGGVAYGLLAKAGPSLILNELAKFTPVEQASVVVTSGGNLPVHYILHAAALKIAKDATYLVTQDDVRNTVKAAVEKADVLKIGLLFVPLLGAGLAPLTPHQSLDGILQALRMHNTNSPLRVDIVVFREKELPRNEVRQLFEAVLGNDFVISD